MTTLTLYDETAPHRARATIADFGEIADALVPFGVLLERWSADIALTEDAGDLDILGAYAADVERLKSTGGYRSCDVVRLTPANPDAGAMRAKFLAEHVHDDDEVRFFVEGSGLFYIRGKGIVAALECTRGDLIVLPAGTRHWFDTGARPRFTAIRLFTTPEGWVARFTGDTIAGAIPLYEGRIMIPGAAPAAIVTDIEGTTSSIAFVHDVLFPYARQRLADFVRSHPADVASILAEVRAEDATEGLEVDDCIARLLEWQDADRKIAPLKQLQGLIWREGFESGAFSGHVYPDAAMALKGWHARGIPLYVYSSGSVEAQKLIFGHSDHGDLLPLFSGHFDTAVGGKKEPASYAAIARAISAAPADILFLSDSIEELTAARAAGLRVVLLARNGVPATDAFPVATSFATILPAGAAA